MKYMHFSVAMFYISVYAFLYLSFASVLRVLFVLYYPIYGTSNTFLMYFSAFVCTHVYPYIYPHIYPYVCMCMNTMTRRQVEGLSCVHTYAHCDRCFVCVCVCVVAVGHRGVKQGRRGRQIGHTHAQFPAVTRRTRMSAVSSTTANMATSHWSQGSVVTVVLLWFDVFLLPLVHCCLFTLTYTLRPPLYYYSKTVHQL